MGEIQSTTASRKGFTITLEDDTNLILVFLQGSHLGHHPVRHRLTRAGHNHRT